MARATNPATMSGPLNPKRIPKARQPVANQSHVSIGSYRVAEDRLREKTKLMSQATTSTTATIHSAWMANPTPKKIRARSKMSKKSPMPPLLPSPSQRQSQWISLRRKDGARGGSATRRAGTDVAELV
jgi:hypothetical protein